jgi:L-2-hydroxyglutarate oxidase LhgO
VTHIEPDSDAYRIATSRQELRASCLINAAGLHADEVASMVLPSARYALAPLRGEYYEITTEPTKRLIGRLVYPALPAGTVGKGIHFSPRPNGRMFLGPNTVPVESKTDYTSNRTPPHAFLHAVQKFLPVIEERDLRWAYSGIRPRLRTAHGGQEDFVISADVDDPLLINLVGIDSPGLSAALGIARYVAEMPCLQRRFHS